MIEDLEEIADLMRPDCDVTAENASHVRRGHKRVKLRALTARCRLNRLGSVCTAATKAAEIAHPPSLRRFSWEGEP